MNSKIEIKQNLQNILFEKLYRLQDILSVTIVGSFVDQEDLSGISDIDTIVICQSLNKKLFNDCLNVVKEINLKNCGLENYSIKINDTFGPLKFDEPNLAVIHLMVYDISSHRKHVLASPFTCFDWERSKNRLGKSLKEIFPVGLLQFRDFMEVRRSLENYINDLDNNVISYRKYNFTNGDVNEIKKNKLLDQRHQGEYAYHIVRNLIANYLKLNINKNIPFSNIEIKEEIKRIFSEEGEYHANMFDKISTIKSQREANFPEDTVRWTRNFLINFQKAIKSEWNNAIPIHCIRHHKTNLNDGTFLGQGRDPGIDKSTASYLKYETVSKVYSSPMRRCIETASKFCNKTEIERDDRLLEFNYGHAEGLDYKQLSNQYSKILNEWKNGGDPRFPKGENTKDVHIRLESFLDDLAKTIENNEYKSISIVTHNGVIRCLLGYAFGLEQRDWYKLIIPHGIPLEFLYKKNKFYPNIPRKLWGNILENIGYSEI